MTHVILSLSSLIFLSTKRAFSHWSSYEPTPISGHKLNPINGSETNISREPQVNPVIH